MRLINFECVDLLVSALLLNLASIDDPILSVFTVSGSVVWIGNLSSVCLFSKILDELLSVAFHNFPLQTFEIWLMVLGVQS